MGIAISTDDYGVTVWRSDKFGFPQYAIGVQKKEQDRYITDYQAVRFKKGVELENKEKIKILHAFPVLDTWEKNGQDFKRIVWMITDFTYMDRAERPVQGTQMQMASVQRDNVPEGFNAVEDDIPF